MRAKYRPGKYAMLGFDRDDIDEIAWLGEDYQLVESMNDAKRFEWSGRKKKGKGDPQSWLDYINSDEELNHGYEFHLVKVLN